MARRSPAQVRANLPRRNIRGERFSVLSGVSARGIASIARLERTRLWPGAAAEAFHSWARFVRDPMRRQWDLQYGCRLLGCCPDPDELRDVLDLVADALPAKDARAFRKRLAALDDLW
ncbi:hypothetical protein B1813_00750 [Saccharomonospora piscinae]|uniref:Uncharacterized protein n=1 Tax=Saccharomonospora piscinae TaxID=687388 RepID=A0A1V9AC10_SACPI|nr:hypothetical protein [Saccharomonospora piscinae]OQO94669.1 hypothetical protein B1813_00750 [Saccharomonospora piscinae]